MNVVEVGKFLGELRKEKELKQKEVAEIIQVSDKAVSRWETGRGMPDVESLQNLSDFYEVSINEILAGKRFATNEVERETDNNVKELVRSGARLRRSIWMLICGVIVLLVCLFTLAIFTYEPDGEVVWTLNFTEENVDNIYSKLRILEKEDIDYSVEIDTDTEKIKIIIDANTKAYKSWAEKNAEASE